MVRKEVLWLNEMCSGQICDQIGSEQLKALLLRIGNEIITLSSTW